jgi:hypothetical protein
MKAAAAAAAAAVFLMHIPQQLSHSSKRMTVIQPPGVQ